MELIINQKMPNSATFDPGNICNLACSTCDELASTRWQALKKLPIDSNAFNQTIDDLDFTGLKHIIIGGGEPILHKSTHEVLEKFKNTDMRFQHTLQRHSETKFRFLNTCAYYNDITICFSIDGVEEHFEYLRWPAKWTKVDSNVKWIVKHAPANMKFGVNITVSVLNKDSHKLVVDWAKTTLPEEHYISYNSAGTNFKTFDKVDKLRGTDWRKTFHSINTTAQ